MPYARRICVPCGYTCQPVEDVPVYQEYMDAIVEDIIKTHTQYLVPCGGPTWQKSFPGMTEARRIAEYIVPRVPFPMVVSLEEGSFTTYDNIRGASVVIRGLVPPDSEWCGSDPRVNDITIWCEATRGLKVDILSRHFMPRSEGQPRIRIKTSSWEAARPGKELLATLEACVAIKVPLLNSIQRAQRIALSKMR